MLQVIKYFSSNIKLKYELANIFDFNVWKQGVLFSLM